MNDLTQFPFFRGDAIILKHPSGALIKDGVSSYLVRGDGAYLWLSRMVGMLDGSHTLGEILGLYSEELRPTAQELISLLASQKTVRWLTRSWGGSQKPLDGLESFLANWTDSPDSVARSFRTTRIEVVGSGHDAVAFIRTLKDNGAEDVGIVDAEVARGPWVVAVSSVPEGQLQSLAARAQAGEFVLLPLVLSGDALVLGPFIGDRYNLRLDGVLEALRRNDGSMASKPSDEAEKETRKESDGSCSSTVSPGPLDLMGTHTAFEVFKEITGVMRSQLVDSVCVMDVPSLDMHLEHPVIPFAVGNFDTEFPSTSDSETDVVLDALLALIAPRTGLASRLDDLDLPQEPLFLAAVAHGWNERRRSVGHSRRHLASARREALLAVLEDVAVSNLSQPSITAAGADAEEAMDRAGWRIATRLLTAQVDSAAGGTLLSLPLPDDSLGELEANFLSGRGLKVSLFVCPEVSDRLVMGAMTDSHGALIGTASQACSTINEAATAVLDRLTAAVQAGQPEPDLVDLPDLRRMLLAALAGQDENTAPTQFVGDARTPVSWSEILGRAVVEMRDITPMGLTGRTPARVYAVSVTEENPDR